MQLSIKPVALCFLGFWISGIYRPSTGFFVSRPSTMVLENNEYKNVVIAIHESITEDPSLIDTLKDTMTKASKYLYTATRQRAFFKEIKILLPSSWSNNALYSVPTTETLAFADVIITDPIRGKRSLPQARSYDGCGKQGVHVLLTKEFLTIPRAEPYFNDPAKYFIHGFAQFRWGVFQEYAEEGEREFYMSPTTGRPEPIKCTIMLRGLVQKNDSAHTICYLPSQAQSNHVIASVDPNTGLYDTDCMWRPYPNRQRTKASLMDHQYIQELETFCDDNNTNYMTKHNDEAPSKHNRLCGHRSTWEIISQTDDFRNGKNPPRGLLDSQLQPTFIVMRATSRKRRAALMIDPSVADHFEIQQALGRLKHEASIHDIDFLIIYSRQEKISLENLQSIENIKRLLRQHSENKGAHFLDECIQKAAQAFEKEGEANNTHLIVVTNKHPHYVKKLEGLKASAISSHNGVGINDAEISSYHAVGQKFGHTFLDRLRQVIQPQDAPGSVIISRDEIHLSETDIVSGFVEIDPSLATHVTFIFHYEMGLPYIDLWSPSRVVYDMESVVCQVDFDFKVIRFHLNFIETGTWTFKIKQSSTNSQKVQLIVLSKEDHTSFDPVVVRPSVKKCDGPVMCLRLHVDVTQGNHPLIGLNTTARIETPNGEIASIRLLDNGAGADISKNDGIFSRNYLLPNLTGSYHVTFVVTGKMKNSQRKEETFTFTNDDTSPLKKLVTKIAIDGNIQREVSGGTIFIQNIDAISSDVIAPARITDLEAIRYIPYRNNIVLQWTAPGDDLDHGKPYSYELFIGYDIRNIRLFLQYTSTGSYDGAGHVAREIIIAKTSATKTEILLWDVKLLAKSYVFAIRAVDYSGNVGDISNVAIAPEVIRRS